jgi:DNA-binding transcriptional MocR family regulator
MKPIELAERLGRWSSGRGPLPVLLAARLRRLIDEGELTPGEPLPPDRTLASALAVGRSTVVAAYDLLRQDGRIVRQQGSGTRVAGTEPAGPRPATSAPMFLHLLEPRDGVIPLACAAPDRPPPELAAAYERIVPVLAAVTGDIGYYPAGHPLLRRALADHCARQGLPTGPERILVTSGGQQALSLLARALLVPGDRVLVEAPTYPGALEAFREQAAVLRSLPGLRDLAFPGVELPAPVAAYADDVITIGSLSKSVWGGLRIGWVRAPEPLIGRLARLLAVHGLGVNAPAQLAAAELLPCLEELCQRQAPIRQARHDHLRAQLARRLPAWDVPRVQGGQTLWVRLPHGDGTSFAQAAQRHGVAVLPGSGLDASGQSQEYLRLHFLATPDDLTEAARRLATAWRTYRPPAAPAVSPPAMSV